MLFDLFDLLLCFFFLSFSFFLSIFLFLCLSVSLWVCSLSLFPSSFSLARAILLSLDRFVCSSLTAERAQFRVRSTHLYRTELTNVIHFRLKQFASEMCCSFQASEPGKFKREKVGLLLSIADNLIG